MALVETNLFETIDKVEMSIARIKDFEPPEGYYLAFSGGKDSCVIKHLADRAGVKYDAHYNVTNLDPPELVRFIKKQHSDVGWSLPKESFGKALRRKMMLPTRAKRWCCDLLKERAGKGRTVMTGVRNDESSRRRNRRMYEVCHKNNTKKYFNPIIDWEDEDVWEYIHQECIPYCSLYDEGFKRLGCVMCPMATDKNKQIEANRWPSHARRWRRYANIAFDLAEEHRPKDKFKFKFKSGDEYYEWWLKRQPPVDENQMCMIFE